MQRIYFRIFIIFCITTSLLYAEETLKRRGVMGFGYNDLKSENSKGILIDRVLPNSAAKEAGLVDVENAWLAEVDPSEIERSVGSLTQSGALDETGALTEYGFMLRRFSYSSKLVDILRVADDKGCLIEMATVLPVMKNDGDRRLLKTNFRWDVYTKRMAQKRHQALMAGCIDDIEFILKLYKAWDELPWLNEKQLRNLSNNTETREEMKDQLRRQWAKIHSVNHETLLAIREERQEIVDAFNISMKSDQVRSPEPILHSEE